MRKRVDHDATQEVSSSQLVPDAKPPVYGNVPKNDASMWLSAPVSADDFVGAANKKKRSASRGGGRGLVLGATAIALLGVTGAGVYYALLRDPPTHASALEATPSAAPAAPAQTPESPSGSAQAPAPAPAQVAAPAVAADAGLATAPADAVAADVAALEADAVSAADPAIKKATKKRATTKKKVVKKKKRR